MYSKGEMKMRDNTIRFRTIKTSDYKALEKIIRDTWEYEKFCSPKIAKEMSRIYLASCLATQTYNLVALNNEQPVGIIMGKNKRVHPVALKYRIRQIFSAIHLMATNEGRQVTKVFSKIEKLDKELLQIGREHV